MPGVQLGSDLVDVATGAGVFTARREGDLVRATGIRYARAERFRAPVAEPVHDRPVDATSLAPACPQNPTPLLDDLLVDATGDLTVDEDCLRLSVTAPADAHDLPVMVFLHGGSYRAGAGDAPVFDPRALVGEQRVVVVAVTYRLGLLIGSTAREVALFVPGLTGLPARALAAPLVGRLLTRAAVAVLSWKVYGAAVRRFARRHAAAGGRASTYRLEWGPPGPYRGAHCVDLPLLFTDEAAWRSAPLVAGADWSDVEARGRQLRQVWAEFARTGLAPLVDEPGFLRTRQVS
ncbi:Carboxylesterase family protein [Klenkia marina]|uniref:Carboxylesterase family protein n=1 Tax=Klenkia marina TaxID=1960309 RepID=A0A1G4YP86_9ACTN|nr:Carboxylesterase family protein [Klenkia marina]